MRLRPTVFSTLLLDALVAIAVVLPFIITLGLQGGG